MEKIFFSFMLLGTSALVAFPSAQARVYIADSEYDLSITELNSGIKPSDGKCPLRAAIESAIYADTHAFAKDQKDKYPELCPGQEDDPTPYRPEVIDRANQHIVVLDTSFHYIPPQNDPISIVVSTDDIDGNLRLRIVPGASYSLNNQDFYDELPQIAGALPRRDFINPSKINSPDSKLLKIDGSTAKQELTVEIYGILFTSAYTSGQGSALSMQGSTYFNPETQKQDYNTFVRVLYSVFFQNYAEGGGPVYNEGADFTFFKSHAIANHAEHPIYKGEVNRLAGTFNNRDTILTDIGEIDKNRPYIWENNLQNSRGGFYYQAGGKSRFQGNSLALAGQTTILGSPENREEKSVFMTNHAHRDGGVFYCQSGEITLSYIEALNNVAGNPDDTFSSENRGLEPKGISVDARSSLGGGVLALSDTAGGNNGCVAKIEGSTFGSNVSYKSSAIAAGTTSQLLMEYASVIGNSVAYQDYFLESEENTFNRTGATITVRGSAFIDKSSFWNNVGGAPSVLKIENIKEGAFLLANSSLSDNSSRTVNYNITRTSGMEAINMLRKKVPFIDIPVHEFILFGRGDIPNPELSPFIQTHGTTVMFKGNIDRNALAIGNYRLGSTVAHNSFWTNKGRFQVSSVPDNSGIPSGIYILNNLFDMLKHYPELLPITAEYACSQGGFLGPLVNPPQLAYGNVELGVPYGNTPTCPATKISPFDQEQKEVGTQMGIALLPLGIKQKNSSADPLVCAEFPKDQIGQSRADGCISGAIQLEAAEDCDPFEEWTGECN